MLAKIKMLGIEEEVLYLGRREDIHQFYNAMDCFLLPSLYEGVPVVGLEAESCGLPVFFSTEIPEESNVCNDIGFFIKLEKKAEYWAEYILEKIKPIISLRHGHEEILKMAGFDSAMEGKKLQMYYERILKK